MNGSRDVELYGPIGDAVKRIAPYVETDPVGIYAACLSMWSMAIGNRVFMDAGRRRSPLVSTALVADTGTGKGVSLEASRHIMAESIGRDIELRETSGLTSGAALVDHVYRQMVKTEEAYGIADTRVLVIEEEWREILERTSRDSSFTSKIRHCWDCATLRNTTKKKSENDVPQEVRNARVVFHTHITPSDWRKFVSFTDAAGGSFNRILPIALDDVPLLRKRKLPPVDTTRLIDAWDWASSERHVMQLTTSADNLNWVLRRGERVLLKALPAHQGDFVARTAEQTTRVAALLATSEGTDRITRAHMNAAVTFVRHSVRTVLDLTKDGPGKKAKATPEDRVLAELGRHPGGMRSAVLQRASGALAHDLQSMEERGLIMHREIKDGPGRPVKLYQLIGKSGLLPRPAPGKAMPSAGSVNPFLMALQSA
ncbi:DUF3987 domain-containing protein [Streptomyces melanogenes]|uniref:DUF3987 domain-containing protein n=1 Tax=Streptomyces melanogenes TaxID=67326 RepID=UPI00167CB41C|nr:DUF3987 domain-containing protein [Streptomyces melanogenes]GGP71982.1 hypothetical protein GCM10010278_57490 [Streptomyces melanogenes]